MYRLFSQHGASIDFQLAPIVARYLQLKHSRRSLDSWMRERMQSPRTVHSARWRIQLWMFNRLGGKGLQHTTRNGM